MQVLPRNISSITANVNDYRLLTKRRLPKFLFEHIDGGSFSETTLRSKCTDLQAFGLRQCVLRDISNIDTQVKLFGQHLKLPIILGSISMAGLNARRGEVLAAQAAEEQGVPFLPFHRICVIRRFIA